MRQIVAGTLLALLVAALAWYNLRDQGTGGQRERAEVDQKFTDFSAEQYARDGLPQWQLKAAAVEHRANKSGYRILRPDLTFSDRRRSGPPWKMTAPIGNADEDLTEVRLRGGVVGTRAAWAGNGRLKLTTERLTIRPKQHTANSRTETEISENRPPPGQKLAWRSRSQGFALDYDDQILQQSRVQDLLEPRPRPAPTTNRK